MRFDLGLRFRAPRRWENRLLFARLALMLIGLTVGAFGAHAETRVALVIGNGAYRDVATLANPPNDARDVAAELKTSRFNVTRGVTLDQAAMERAIAGR